MKLTFYGATKEVTGSNAILEAAGKKVMIDCGMFQGSSATKALNYEKFAYNASEIDYMILTHAHIDHSGRIPLLYKRGYKGSVICTKATKELCEIMLIDSANIQESDTEYKNIKRLRAGNDPLEPLYTVEDATLALKRFEPVHYHEIIKLDDNISIRFMDAGHILGSSSVTINIFENDIMTTLVFTGDIGKRGTPIINDPEYIEGCDYLIMESTYGNKKHMQANNPDETMFKIIDDTLDRRGTVIIPSFAVGRTQEMIYAFNKNLAIKSKLSKFWNIPVYVDSPLSTSATSVFKNNSDDFDDEAKQYIKNGDNPLDFPNLKFTASVEESKALNKDNYPKIIVSSSGMCDAGRIRHHLKHNLYKPNTTVLFVGYQAEGSLGRLLVDGVKKVRILGETINVKARIEMIDGFSGHGDMDDLDDFIGHIKKKPVKVFLVHGEADQILPFSERIKSKFGIDTVIAEKFETYELFDGLGVTELKQDAVLKDHTDSKLVLLNLVTDVKRKVKDVSELIAYDEINKLSESQITAFIDFYSAMNDQMRKLVTELEIKAKSNDK
ncbi:MAG: MBL fold metallo-hydrolase [Clostridia bacterium]